MTWFKVDDKFHDHPKVRLLLELYEADAVTAIGLWGAAGSWCGDQRSDGLISGFVLARWRPDWQVYAAMLEEVGLWHRLEVNGRPHVQFHDFTDTCTCPGRDVPKKGRGWNPSREKQEADAAYDRRKKELYKDHALVAAVKERDGERCRYCGSGVNFNDRVSDSGGQLDHVDPDGPNNLQNLVVACRGCNAKKGHRTPEQWGFGLIRPGSMGPMRRLQIVSSADLGPEQQQGGPARAGSGSGSGSGSGKQVGSGSDLGPDLDPEADAS